MSWHKVEINQRVRLKLTPEGRQQLKLFWEGYILNPSLPEVDKDGYVMMTLRTAFCVFGDQLKSGTSRMFDNEFLLENYTPRRLEGGL